VCIGDRYRIGEAEFEVTQPRVTCYRVGLRLGEPRMPALLVAHRRPGFYLRVLREGPVRAGDDIVRIGAAAERVSVAVTDAQLYLPGPDVTTMRRLLTVGALSPGWQGSFRDLVERAATAAPAWDGFRPMRVARLVHETDLVTSVYLRPSTPQRLPAPMPGQYLTIRLTDAADPRPVRNYSLSAATADGYRISVKREPKGLASTYIATALAVGDQLDVAAPRGQFVLDDGAAPVVLLSAGIGVTPVLAMLEALAAQHSPREVWWLHTTRDPATHVLADEARRLLARAARGARPRLLHRNKRSPGPRRARRARPARRRPGLPVRTARLHGRDDGRADRPRPAVRPHPHRAVHLVDGDQPGGRRCEPARSARAHQARQRADGHLRPRGAFRGLRRVRGQPARDGRGCDVPTRWSCRTGVCHTCSTPLLAGAVD
jgi:ferredoxin-NADP reductase